MVTFRKWWVEALFREKPLVEGPLTRAAFS